MSTSVRYSAVVALCLATGLFSSGCKLWKKGEEKEKPETPTEEPAKESAKGDIFQESGDLSAREAPTEPIDKTNAMNRVSITLPSESRSARIKSIEGREFVFRKTASASSSEYTYIFWRRASEPSGGERPILLGKSLDYLSYVGKKGKFLRKSAQDLWHPAVLETGEKVYATHKSYGGVYFVDSYAEARSKIGRTIWTKLPSGAKDARVLHTADPAVSYPKGNLEKLTVIGVDTMIYGHSRLVGEGSFSLVVRKATGEEGLLPYDERHFHGENPIDPQWDSETVQLMRDQKIRIGMTERQALLSWGVPEKRNKTVGQFGVHEQWVYSIGQYLYFENGKLTSFQTTR